MRASKLRNSCHAQKLVYVGMNEDANLAAEAFRRGASGYFVKTSELVIAVREVLRRRSCVSAEVVKDTFRLRQGKELVGSPIGNAKSFSS
jgi:DNA-binding NarL/FixJ family response regulator